MKRLRLGIAGLGRAFAVSAPSLREEYESTAPPFFVRKDHGKSLFGRLFGG